MGVLRLFFCILLLVPAVGGFTQESVHIVRRGDTIYSLARQYGVAVQEITNLNGITDPARIREGQRIRIPRGGDSAGVAGAGEAAGRFLEYQAVRGDSLYALARRHGTTMDAIREASGLSADYVLKAGDRLRIPRSGTPPPAVIAAPVVPAASGGGSGNGGAQTAPRATAPARTADGSVRWPIEAREVAYLTGKMYGVVLLGGRSEPVKSLTQGVVVSAGPYRGFGRVAVVQVAGGYFYVYGGCESLSVREGDRVAPDTELGRLGVDGVSSKPQLFFLVYRNNAAIDPAGAPRS